MRKKTVSMIMVLTLCFGLALGTIGSAGLVIAQENQTAGSNTTSNASTTTGNVTTAEKFENITHGGGPGAGATTYSER